MMMVEISLLLVGLSLVVFVVVKAVNTEFAFGLRYGPSVRHKVLFFYCNKLQSGGLFSFAVFIGFSGFVFRFSKGD